MMRYTLLAAFAAASLLAQSSSSPNASGLKGKPLVGTPSDGQTWCYVAASSRYEPCSGATGPGTGDVNGPASSVSGNLPSFNGTSGKTVQDSGVSAASVSGHVASTSNPHSVTKTQVGLGNVPNTDATARANHTGSQTASTISDFSTAANAATAGTYAPAAHASSTTNPHSTSDANLVTTDVTTNDASTSKHGFLKKLSGSATEYMNGQGNWATPSGGAHTQNTDTGTTQTSFQIDSGNSGCRWKMVSGVMVLRNAADSADCEMRASAVSSSGTGPGELTEQATPGAAPPSGKLYNWAQLTSNKGLWSMDSAGNSYRDVKPTTCSGTNKVSAIGNDGVPVCSADESGAASHTQRWVCTEELMLATTGFLECGLNGAIANSGTLAAGTVTASEFGTAALSTSTSANARSSLSSTNTGVLLFGGGTYITEARIRTPSAVSDGTDTYTLYSGFSDDNTGNPVDACGFRYSHSINSGKWQILCTTSFLGSATTADAGVTVAADTVYKLRVVVNAAGTSAEFFINGSSVGTISSTMPNGASDHLGVVTNIIKSAGTSARVLLVDYIHQDFTLTTSR